MLVAFDKEKNRIYANAGLKFKECFCPRCGEPLIHRVGQKNIPHFAHKVKSNCPEDKDNKSAWHRHMQELFPQEAVEVIFYDKNDSGRKYIADVYLKDSNTVIEFQHSPISVDDFKNRTIFHLSEGRRIIWIFDVSKKDATDCYLKHCFWWKDMKHSVFQWKRNQGGALSAMFGELGDDQYSDVSICVYCGNDGDIVHRIISHNEKYDRIMLSVHSINLVNMDINEFFFEELRWTNPAEWIRRKEAREQVSTENHRNLLKVKRYIRRRRRL